MRENVLGRESRGVAGDRPHGRARSVGCMLSYQNSLRTLQHYTVCASAECRGTLFRVVGGGCARALRTRAALKVRVSHQGLTPFTRHIRVSGAYERGVERGI